VPVISFAWRRLVAQGGLIAAGSGEEVVPASDYRALQSQVREGGHTIGAGAQAAPRARAAGKNLGRGPYPDRGAVRSGNAMRIEARDSPPISLWVPRSSPPATSEGASSIRSPDIESCSDRCFKDFGSWAGVVDASCPLVFVGRGLLSADCVFRKAERAFL
jgi:hypothetical protein